MPASAAFPVRLQQALKDDSFLNQTDFEVPSKAAKRMVGRTPAKLKTILSSAGRRDLYSALVVNLVAIVEGYLNDVVSEVLRFDNRKLKQGVAGMDLVRKIDIQDILDSTSKDNLVEAIIAKHLQSLFYAAPSTQLAYFAEVIGD